jgi:hypothetical protein
MKRWPSEDEGIAVLWSSTNLDDEGDVDAWGGPYLEKPVTTDQWGSEWIYQNPSEVEGLPYGLVSIGPDREEGTEDDLSIHDDIVGEDGVVDDEFADFTTSTDSNR